MVSKSPTLVLRVSGFKKSDLSRTMDKHVLLQFTIF